MQGAKCLTTKARTDYTIYNKVTIVNWHFMSYNTNGEKGEKPIKAEWEEI